LSQQPFPAPLRQRIPHLPLILAGPILRQTTPQAVTVWVALKAPREVTLNVYATDEGGGRIGGLQLQGTCPTVPIGQQLHLIAVTATPLDGQPLEPGQLYAYDLSFGTPEENLTQALNSPISISYFPHQLPTFALPPKDLNDLKIAHGSCRKLHSSGRDALPLLDDAIANCAARANARLHQLFFTGDQIYADDVADALLAMATDIGDTLLGWEEKLPLGKTPKNLKPGERSDVARDECGFTAMFLNCPEKAKSHLFSFGEYCAMYLLCWSSVLWCDDFPTGKALGKSPKQAKLWDKEVRHLKDCQATLGKVQRAMANVPIYMVCDDHDISDDWYLNREWCDRVLGKPMGRQVVQNGLLAYALFQAWGNTPEQFQPGQPGGMLLEAASRWSAATGRDESASAAVGRHLGLPQTDDKTHLPKFKSDRHVLILDRNSSEGNLPLAWHYTVRSHRHEVLVLDTRTWRGYPEDEEDVAPPMLLSPTAFKQQIQASLKHTDELTQTHGSEIEITFIVLPTNVVSLRIIDLAQRLELETGNVFHSDVGDAWNLNEVGISQLLAELFKRRQQVIVLSGDIHFSGAVRLSYWSNRHFEHPLSDPKQDTSHRKKVKFEQRPSSETKARVLAQLTASAFKNSEFKTYLIHTKAKSLAPEKPQDWAGWNEPPQLIEIQATQETVRLLDVPAPEIGPIVRQLRGTRGNWNVVWEIALKDYHSLPDWQYHIEWIQRQNAQLAPWLDEPPSPDKNSFGKVSDWLSILWRNRWFQEGDEVVGYNNFGMVSLVWSETDEQARAVIQDTFWRPSWQPKSVVYSRYYVPLTIDRLPPLVRVVSAEI
jgi:hypothetical protein